MFIFCQPNCFLIFNIAFFQIFEFLLTSKRTLTRFSLSLCLFILFQYELHSLSAIEILNISFVKNYFLQEKMTADNNNYLDCLRASVGLTGYDEEELSIWYQCPGTRLEEGCFCTDLEDEVLMDCGDPEWIAKFCQPILDAINSVTTTTTPAPEPVQDNDDSTFVSFFVFFISFFCLVQY